MAFIRVCDVVECNEKQTHQWWAWFVCQIHYDLLNTRGGDLKKKTHATYKEVMESK